jgi:hypothetical protein
MHLTERTEAGFVGGGFSRVKAQTFLTVDQMGGIKEY